MANGWKISKYILTCLHWMKLIWGIQLCKNVFAINNGNIVLSLHKQDFTEGLVEVCTVPSLTRGVYPARPGPWFFQRAESGRQTKGNFPNGPGRASNWEVIFQTGLAGPANERWISNGPRRASKKEMSSPRAGPGPKKSARADLYREPPKV